MLFQTTHTTFRRTKLWEFVDSEDNLLDREKIALSRWCLAVTLFF